MGVALDLFVFVVYVAPIGSKHESESLFQNTATNIIEVQILGGMYYWVGILMRVLQHYQIPLTLLTFVNCYRRPNSLRLSNQALWLNNRIVTPVLVVGAYAMMLGWSSSMIGHLVTNQGSSFAWQMGSVALSTMFLVHL